MRDAGWWEADNGLNPINSSDISSDLDGDGCLIRMSIGLAAGQAI